MYSNARKAVSALVAVVVLFLSIEELAAQSHVGNVPWSTSYYTYTRHNNIVYGQGEINGGGSFKDLTLDLYIPDIPTPENAKNRLPLMLMIHGGGFQNGTKSDTNVVRSARDYAERGWLVASINYRLMGDNPIPSARVQPFYDGVGGAGADVFARTIVAAVDDTLTALEFLQARDDVYAPWTTLWGSSAGAVTSLITAYSMDDLGIARPPVAAVFDHSGGVYVFTDGNPFDDPGGSDPVLMVVHGTDDRIVPFSEATKLQNWAGSAGLPLDFQALAGVGHVPNLYNYNATTGVSLFQRSVDFHHETVFAGLSQGPQPALPPGC